MGTTTNNGWTYPESTDLVKDGATAIQTLADDIDTTLGVYADPGLVLLNTTSFSGVTSVSQSSVLTSTYNSYRVVMNYLVATGGTNISFRFRENTTDFTSAAYSGGSYRTTYLGTTGAVDLANGATALVVAQGNASFSSFLSFDINRENAVRGIVSGLGYEIQDAKFRHFGAYATGMTNFNGFSLFTAAGNFSGQVAVYGYNQ